MSGSLGSVDTGIRGLAFIMAAKSAISVVSTCVSILRAPVAETELKIRLAMPIIFLQEPPCEKHGEG